MANSTNFVNRYRQAITSFCESLDLANAKIDQYTSDPTILDAHFANIPSDPIDPITKQDLINAGGVIGEVNTFLAASGRLAKLAKLR